MIVKYKAITSSTRNLALIKRSDLYKSGPVKFLCFGGKNSGGRNNRGVITSRHIGGGCKKKLRNLNFDFNSFAGDQDIISCTVERIEHDPGRSSFISLCKSLLDGRFFYMLAIDGMKSGDNFSIISQSSDFHCDVGCVARLSFIPNGTVISCIEVKPGAGMKLARSAGAYATLVKKYDTYALVLLRNGCKVKVSLNCFAILGVISNGDHINESYAKAGRVRWKGRRPTVRGVVMNPVDHPHGGGEGKSKSGRHPCTPWGKLTKGKKTVKKKVII